MGEIGIQENVKYIHLVKVLLKYLLYLKFSISLDLLHGHVSHI